MVPLPSLMPFLHPLPPPRALFARHFLRRMISTTSQVHHEASAASPASPASQSTQGSPPPILNYHVHRTASNQLPIYHLAKRGGNLHQTRIRKIDGDIAELRDELQRALKLKEENIVINQLTRHIIIKGWMKADVAKFLENRQF